VQTHQRERSDRRRLTTRTIAALAAGGAMIGTAIAIAPHLLHPVDTRMAASVIQGGCNPYQVQAVSLGTFDMTVCLTDNGTGATAYPEIHVDQVPPYLGTSCTIAIELWDDSGSNYGTPKQADCQTGTYPGNSFGPVSKQLTLHAFARLKVCLLTSCTAYYLGNKEGDSPSINLQPIVATDTATATETSAATEPLPSQIKIPPPPPIGNRQPQANCLNSRPNTGPTVIDGINSNSIVEDNGNGWNQYTTQTDYGNRPGTATACLDRAHREGTGSSQIDIVGWQDAMDMLKAWNADPTNPPNPLLYSQLVNHCHLIAGTGNGRNLNTGELAQSLGGSGTQPSNLVPCWHSTTNSGKLGMSAQEAIVKEIADHTQSGQAVYYQVTPNYAAATSTTPCGYPSTRPYSTIPCSITMIAFLQTPGLSPQQKLNATIPNSRPTPTRTGQRLLMLGN
jgi:hypothetical protein